MNHAMYHNVEEIKSVSGVLRFLLVDVKVSIEVQVVYFTLDPALVCNFGVKLISPRA